MPQGPAGGLPRVAVKFGSVEWQEEVERLDPRSAARRHAESARRAIERGESELAWMRCLADGPAGTHLPGCRKLYVPLARSAPSEAPYGFIFQLTVHPDRTLTWSLIAFGERHPAHRATRSVYERAHRRLHARYP